MSRCAVWYLVRPSYSPISYAGTSVLHQLSIPQPFSCNSPCLLFVAAGACGCKLGVKRTWQLDLKAVSPERAALAASGSRTVAMAAACSTPWHGGHQSSHVTVSQSRSVRNAAQTSSQTESGAPCRARPRHSIPECDTQAGRSRRSTSTTKQLVNELLQQQRCRSRLAPTDLASGDLLSLLISR